jgi:hypothetical protein
VARVLTRARAATLTFWVAVVLAAVLRVLPIQDHVSTSFAGYWVVARELSAGTPVVDLYDDAVLNEAMAKHGVGLGDKLIGPPSLVLTLAPLADLPYTTARRIWLWAVCLPALVGALWSLRGIAGPVAGGLLGAAFLLGTPAEHGFAVGQVYTVFLALHVSALLALQRGGTARFGFAVAPMMALRGWVGLPLLAGAMSRPRAVIAALGATVALLLLSVPWVGVDAWVWFFQTHLGEMAASPWAGTPAYQTLRSLLLHLTTADPHWGPDPPIPVPGLGQALFIGAAMALAGGGLWLTRRAGPAGLVTALGLWTALELLLAPVAEGYHFVLAALPAATALGRGRTSERVLVLLALPLLLLDLPYQDPSLWGGWRSLLAYPRVAGVILLGLANARILWRSAGTGAFAPGLVDPGDTQSEARARAAGLSDGDPAASGLE